MSQICYSHVISSILYTLTAIKDHIDSLKCHICIFLKMCQNVHFYLFLVTFWPLMTSKFTFYISFRLIWLKQSNTNILSGKRPLCDNFHKNYNQICNPYPKKGLQKFPVTFVFAQLKNYAHIVSNLLLSCYFKYFVHINSH